MKKLLITYVLMYFHLFLLYQTRKIDFFVSYIGEKFRDFPWKNNPNTVKLTLTLVKITLRCDNPKLGLGLGLLAFLLKYM